MRFVDIDFHEFDVFHFSLESVSCFETIFVELSFDGTDVSSGVFFVLSEALFHDLVDLTLYEVELLHNDWHHLGIEAWEFVVEGIEFKTDSVCEDLKSFHGLSSGIVGAIDGISYYIFKVALSIVFKATARMIDDFLLISIEAIVVAACSVDFRSLVGFHIGTETTESVVSVLLEWGLIGNVGLSFEVDLTEGLIWSWSTILIGIVVIHFCVVILGSWNVGL